METRTIKNTGRIFFTLIMGALLIGTVFAEGGNINFEDVSRNREAGKISRSLLTAAENSAETNSLSAAKASFNLASKFAIAIADASHLDTDEAAVKTIVVDLAYLIDSLENQREQETLQKILKSIIRGNTESAAVVVEVEKAYASYTSRQNPNQKWHLASGSEITKLIYSTYVGDNAAMRKNLSEIEKLIKIAPKEISGQSIEKMKSLSRYAANSSFAEKDYTDIFAETMSLFQTMSV